MWAPGAKEADGATGYRDNPTREWVADGPRSERRIYERQWAEGLRVAGAVAATQELLGQDHGERLLGHPRSSRSVDTLPCVRCFPRLALLSDSLGDRTRWHPLWDRRNALCALRFAKRPVSLASKALYEYLDSGRMPSLPTDFTD